MRSGASNAVALNPYVDAFPCAYYAIKDQLLAIVGNYWVLAIGVNWLRRTIQILIGTMNSGS